LSDLYDITYDLEYIIYPSIELTDIPLELESAYREALWIIYCSYQVIDAYTAYREVINLYVEHSKEKIIEYVDQQLAYYYYVISEEDRENLTELYEDFRSYLDEYKFYGDLRMLADIMEQFLDNITYFDEDSLLEAKYYTSTTLRYEFDLLKRFATDESIANLEALIIAFEEDLDALDTEEAVEAAGNDTLYQVFLAFEKDDDKYALFTMKAMYREIMAMAQNEFDSNLYDSIEFYRLYYQTVQELDLATTAEEIQAIVDAWYDALIELPYEIPDWVNLETVKNDYINNLRYVIYDSMYEGCDITAANQFSLQKVASIESSDDVIEWILDYAQGMTMLNYALAYVQSESFIDYLQENYTYYLSVCLEEFEYHVEICYTALSVLSKIFVDEDAYNDNMEMFFIWMVYVPVDIVKVVRYNAIDALNYEFESLSKTATAESIIAMEDVLNQYLLLISDETDSDVINYLRLDGIDDLYEVYVGIPELQELVAAKDFQYALYNRIYNALSSYIPYLQMQEYRFIYIINYYDRFEEVQSIEEFDIVYADWCDEMRAYAFEDGNLEIARYDFLFDLGYKFSLITAWPEDIITAYNDYVDAITATMNIFDLVNDYLHCFTMLDDYLDTLR
jgi:hypothetical protein